MKPSPIILICCIVFLISAKALGQMNDTLFTDFDLTTLKAIKPAVPQTLEAGQKYIRSIHSKSKSKAKQKIELTKVYRDTSFDSRKARVLNLDYGTVLAFDVLKTPGYEKVFFIADWDYYYDSLLILNDTLFFKEMSDDYVELIAIYPVNNDTFIIKYGSRNTRHDFLKKITFRPLLKNHLNWFGERNNLDYMETYSLVQKNKGYDLVKVNTNQEHISEYDYKRKKEKYLEAGLSPFWIALVELHFE
jgi:hypothetical protein